MEQTVPIEIEDVKLQVQEMLRPFQQEQGRRQKKIDFLSSWIRAVEKKDFFQLDELLKSSRAKEVLDEPEFSGVETLLALSQNFADREVGAHCVKMKSALLQLAEEAELPLEVDFPKFSSLKGIEGRVDFAARKSYINQATLKTLDPRRIISALLKIKRKLYDGAFDPQQFIDSLFRCYREILEKEGLNMGEAVSIRRLYNEYVWSLQSNLFFQNMDKGKFKGYSLEQFAVDLWRFFQSGLFAEGGYCIRLNAGRGKTLWLIDPLGERRHITNAFFAKREDALSC